MRIGNRFGSMRIGNWIKFEKSKDRAVNCHELGAIQCRFDQEH
jgi:hypothetical protein